MIIRFDTKETNIEFVDRFTIKTTEETVDKIVDVGAKCLPINLADVFKKAAKILVNNKNAYDSFEHSQFVTSGVYIEDNNNIEYNNNNTSYLYTKCYKLTTAIKNLKEKAKNNLIDIHFFPVKYCCNNQNKESNYLDYNLGKSLVSMIEMEQSLQWLVGYNENVQFIIEDRDIEKTLWMVANRLSNNAELKKKAVTFAMNKYKNTIDSKYIAEHFQDFWWNVDFFIGKDRYMDKMVHWDSYDKNSFVGIYIYGCKREDSWSSITHKLDDSLCLYVDNNTKMMLKRIQTSMKGKHNQYKNFLKDILGKWFDVDKYWDNFRIYTNRVVDSSLNTDYDIKVCKYLVKDYFDKLGSVYYDGVIVNNETEEQAIERDCKMADINNIEEIVNRPGVVEENIEETLESLKQWEKDNELDKVELPKFEKEEDFWSYLNNL